MVVPVNIWDPVSKHIMLAYVVVLYLVVNLIIFYSYNLSTKPYEIFSFHSVLNSLKVFIEAGYGPFEDLHSNRRSMSHF